MDLAVIICVLLAVILIVAVALKVVAKLTCGRYMIHQDLTNKTVLITGATEGIGLAAARELARHGASVHLLCRNVAKINIVCNQIKRDTSNDRVFVWELDTSQLASVRDFARKFLATSHHIDILINNPGIACLQQWQVSKNGLEMTMALNHFGHSLLTNLLLDRIKMQGSARIVNVSLLAHLLSDGILMHNYSSTQAYNYSKSIDVQFTKHLAHILSDTKVTVNCLHPTDQWNTHVLHYVSWWMQPMVRVLCFWFETVEKGANSILHLAVAPELEMTTGKCFWDCKLTTISCRESDIELAKKFWKIGEELTGVDSMIKNHKAE